MGPRLRLILTSCTDMDSDTMEDMDMPILTSMARGRLRLSLRPSPRPRLILTSCTDMDSDTMDMDSDTMEDTSDTMADSDTTAMDSDTTDTARGLLMLRPIPTFFTEDTLD